MKELLTEYLLPYPMEAVWKVIADTGTHSFWNPQIVSIKGECRKGNRLSVRVKSPIGKGIPFRFQAKVLDFEPNRKLAWTGGVPGILTGYHYWELTDFGDRTKVVQGERFNGLFTAFLSTKRMKAMRPAYESANSGLESYLKGR
ncbi:SRPBCC domain-containing protein [Fictibacillus sp. KIGAM418]|uniref:SRPBCC domain-containing protein n=1 Tax=Fictibacillus marinisediminis TaxID=2878389 RepID=A0A9X1X9X4_9BACL|nr:SRPBCC domain-containing protein [Fictibacillus marinisediminis]MCK6255615.1 SRPBCC domain-containing protein [Fictibacillus marinisediminis]